MNEQRLSKAQWAAWVSIIGNTGLALLKGTVGFYSGSKALIADAAHSASGIGGSAATLIGLRSAHLPPDQEHSHWHGKADSAAAIIVSVLLLFIGVEIGFHSAQSLIQGKAAAPGKMAFAAIVISIVVKEAMFQYKNRLGRKLSSQALIANAREHRSDLYSSLAVLIGVGGAISGELLQLQWMYLLDPAAGVFVALLILRRGYRQVKEAIYSTFDHALHSEQTHELHQAASKVPGVIQVDELRAREYGYDVIVEVKVSVNPRITVLEGQDIAKLVKNRLISKFAHVSDVFVHIHPYDPGYPYKNLVDSSEDDVPTILH